MRTEVDAQPPRTVVEAFGHAEACTVWRDRSRPCTCGGEERQSAGDLYLEAAHEFFAWFDLKDVDIEEGTTLWNRVRLARKIWEVSRHKTVKP